MKIYNLNEINTSNISKIMVRVENLRPISKEQFINLDEIYSTPYYLINSFDLDEILLRDMKYFYHIGRVLKKNTHLEKNRIFIKDYFLECHVNDNPELNFVSISLCLIPNDSELGNICADIIIYKETEKIRYKMTTSFNDMKQAVDDLFYNNPYIEESNDLE